MRLLNYTEFKKLTDFTDLNAEAKFNRFIKQAEETYLTDLIGRELVLKLKLNDYSELLTNVKVCLAHKVELMFVETANVTVIGEGAIQRRSDYSDKADFVDKKGRINMILEILRSYEAQLINKIKAGDYPEWNKGNNVSAKLVFNITSIG